jgi:hypothetical protein
MSGQLDVVYFADRDLGRRFPEELRAAGIAIERHDEHFGSQTPDEVWIPEVARRGWVALTRDSRIRYSPLALRVLEESGARLFVLVGKFTGAEAVATFLKWRTAIEAMARESRAAFVAKIRRDGVLMWRKF